MNISNKLDIYLVPICVTPTRFLFRYFRVHLKFWMDVHSSFTLYISNTNSYTHISNNTKSLVVI